MRCPKCDTAREPDARPPRRAPAVARGARLAGQTMVTPKAETTLVDDVEEEGDEGLADRMGGERDKGDDLIEDVSELGEDKDEMTKVATAVNDGG